MNTPTLIPLNDAESLRAVFAYPATEHSWRWLYRKRHERGLERAFCRVGRRVLVIVPVLQELIRAGSAAP